MLAVCGIAKAHDFRLALNNQYIYFNITGEDSVEVTYKGSIKDNTPTDIAGGLVLPSQVKYNGKVYDVTAIGPKAFSGATKLTSIEIPTGVASIGAFAFEDCTALKRIIFPSNEVTFGEGVFFGCTAIENVSLGSDWRKVNFTMFRWSNRITSVHITPRIERVEGLNRLKKLTSITVDNNNRYLASYDGVLYSKDYSRLYVCPRAYCGTLSIHGNTTEVVSGSLIDAVNIRYIYIPSGVKSLSFREFSRMKNLVSVTFASSRPINTARDYYGRYHFLLQVANPDVVIYVPNKDARKRYKEIIKLEPGKYSDCVESSNLYYEVKENEFPDRNKNIKVNK